MTNLAATVPLALRIALRELRGGLSGFRVFLACLAIGVGAIAAVGSVSSALKQGLAENGQAILGGDVELRLVSHRMTPEQRTQVVKGASWSEIATLRAMARAGEAAAMVEIKAIDDAYPLFGSVRLESGAPVAGAIGGKGPVYGAVVEATFLARLGLEPGAQFRLGQTRFRIAGIIASEPDRVSGGFSFGPRVMMTRDALAATGLVQPGSLVYWHTRLKLAGGGASPGEVAEAVSAIKSRFPDAGWRIRDRTGAAPGIQRFVDRLTQFLTLIGLTSLVVGGVGVASAVAAYMERKRPVIATLKCLGARGHLITAVYLCQVMILALAGSLLGALVGAAAPLALGGTIGAKLPVALSPGFHWQPLATGILFGLLITLVFSLWPLGRAREIRPQALFRDLVDRVRVLPRARFMAGTGLSIAVLVAAMVLLGEDRRLALIYIAAITGTIVFLVLLAAGLKLLLRRHGRPRTANLRLALANLARPGSGLIGIVLAFGLGVALMVAVALIDRNLARDLKSGIPDKAPSFFFLDIQPGQRDDFMTLVGGARGVQSHETGPMLRGRIIAVDAVPADQVRAAPGAGWVLRGDRGLTYADTLPENSRLVAGTWWPPDYDGEPLVSFVSELAEGLGLEIGDTITVNVLGRRLTARIANLREVNWGSLTINFVMVFSPNALKAAPHTHLATVTMDPAWEIALLRQVVARFPNVTAIPVKDALTQVADLMGNLLLGLRIASLVTLISAVLVLTGAMAAGQRRRLYEASILKALGARRGRLIAIYLMEYLMLGAATALFAAIAGTIAAYVIVVHVLKVDWAFSAGIVTATALAAILLTITLGSLNGWRMLGKKPAPLLRSQ